jgi:Trypsin
MRMMRDEPVLLPMRRRGLQSLLLALVSALGLLSAVLLSAALPASAAARKPEHPAGTVKSAKSVRHHANPGSHNQLRAALARASIIGGVAAETGTLPYLAFIIDQNGEGVGLCTGTVLSPNVILTAGHCGENEETGVLEKPEDFTVITGNVEWSASAADKQVSGVSKIVIYPGYLRSDALGDAALLILSTPTTAPAISLATSADLSIIQPGDAAALAGWGKTFFEQEEVTERLRYATTVIQRPSYCEANAPTFFPSEELCVIDPPDDETGACNGDSGGPLLSLAPSGSGLVETGVISHGYGECSTTRPTVVTRADFLASWANGWVAAEKPPPPLPAPAPAPVPAPAPAPVKPAPAPFVPPNLPGIYVTPHSKRGQKITAHVAGDGTHLVGLTAKVTVDCQHGYTFEVDSSWLSYADTVLITNHLATTTLEAETSKYVKAGSIGLRLTWNGTSTLEGRLRIHIRTKHSRAGLCTGTLPFKATE